MGEGTSAITAWAGAMLLVFAIMQFFHPNKYRRIWIIPLVGIGIFLLWSSTTIGRL